MEEDIRNIERIYYDPFEEDLQIIKQNLRNVENSLLKAQLEFEKVQKKSDFIKTAHKSISVEAGHLQQERDDL